jgi:hypothetical protein
MAADASWHRAEGAYVERTIADVQGRSAAQLLAALTAPSPRPHRREARAAAKLHHGLSAH